jgi:hypothetical protein
MLAATGERVEPERQGGAQECTELDGHVVSPLFSRDDGHGTDSR